MIINIFKFICLILGIIFVIPLSVLGMFVTFILVLLYTLTSVIFYILCFGWWRIPWLLFKFGSMKSNAEIKEFKLDLKNEINCFYDIAYVNQFYHLKTTVVYYWCDVIKEAIINFLTFKFL
jgi:lipopolysaccharide/colanic/teichoic acid biosynthesis glycosyltransferase